jgi:hypothetical protein
MPPRCSHRRRPGSSPAGGCHMQRRGASARPPRESQRSASHVLGAKRPPSTAHRHHRGASQAGAYAQAMTPSGDRTGLLAHRYLSATRQSFGGLATVDAIPFVSYRFSARSEGSGGGDATRPAARHARTPSTPTAVPIASETVISAAWIQRNEVGTPFENDRWSARIASPNRGQMSHVHTPTAMRNAAQRREITTGRVCAFFLSAILELWLAQTYVERT